MSFENYLVPVSIDKGYRYDLRKTGLSVGTATLEKSMWVATPYHPRSNESLGLISGQPDLANVKTFKRLAGAEYYLLALVFEGDDYY
jgi:hypothetical protein